MDSRLIPRSFTVIFSSVATGGTIGGLWVKAGHPVMFASRHPEDLKPLVEKLGPLAKAGTVEAITSAIDPASVRVKVTATEASGGAKLDLGEAPVIISGGRGLKEAANFTLVEDLAAAFGNAAVGATRAVTDDGWRPHADQIGQTGRLVSPDLYVACGIKAQFATVEARLVRRKIGRLTQRDRHVLDERIREWLRL